MLLAMLHHNSGDISPMHDAYQNYLNNREQSGTGLNLFPYLCE